MLQLASPPLHTDERLADIHLPLLPLHILPESAMCLLLVPPPHIIRLFLPLV